MVEVSLVGIIFFVVVAILMNFSIHKVEEGHVAVYYRVSLE